MPREPRPSNRVRLARPDDVSVMRDVERAAGELFWHIGMADVAAHEPPTADQLGEYVAAGRAWVSVGGGDLPFGDVPVGDVPVGFALVDLLSRSVHLEQLSVRPDFGRQGRGRELFETVVAYTRDLGRHRVTLSTFAQVPWNAPLYARWGLRVLAPDEVDDELAAFVDHERSLGLDVDVRVFMAIDL